MANAVTKAIEFLERPSASGASGEAVSSVALKTPLIVKTGPTLDPTISNTASDKAAAAMAARSSALGAVNFERLDPVLPKREDHFLTAKADVTMSLWNLIALADSRHDFKTFSQDTPSQKKNMPLDFFTNYSANIQRIVLKLDQVYSSKLTASKRQCSTINTCGNDPEERFTKLIEEIYVNAPNSRVVKSTFKGTAFPSAVPYLEGPPGSDPFGQYHIEIYGTLWEQMGVKVDDRKPIPLIVDTTGTLGSVDARYFKICRPKECTADPSNTSKRAFRGLLLEAGIALRNYPINGVDHEIYGPYDAPVINFKFADGSIFTYQFSPDINRKPNEIEMCKAKIVEKIVQIKQSKSADESFRDYIYPPGTKDDDLTGILDTYCVEYNKIQYNPTKISISNMNEIAVPYIAKRAGDQLQVLACKKQIDYGAGGKIQNCVFWTQDIMAACFAIMNGVTVVHQHIATKDITIYSVDDYKPIYATAGGGIQRPLKMRGGAPCLRSQITSKRFESVDDTCYNLVMTEIININSEHFNPFVALNFLYYYTVKKNESNLKLKEIKVWIESLSGSYEISRQQVFYNKGFAATTGPEQLIEGKYYLIKTLKIEVYKAAEENGYKIKDLGGLITFDEIIKATKEEKKRLEDEASGNNKKSSAGGATPLQTRWERSLTGTTDDTLFMDFLQMLTVCEDEYFRHQDYTDSIYIYDPAADVRIGGHVQIRMMCFIEALIEFYKLMIQQGRPNVFAMIFKYFPTLLNQKGEFAILSDLDIFIQCWFEDFKFPFATALPSQFTTNTIYKKIFDGLMAKVDEKYASVRALIKGTDTEIARSLSSVFPHGSFTIFMNAINAAKEAAAAAAAAPVVYSSPKFVPNYTRKIRTIANVRSNEGPLEKGKVYIGSNGKAVTARRARRTVKNRRQRKARSHA